MTVQRVARGLGWFSIGLGLAELAAPKQFCKLFGAEGHERLVRSFGVREIAAGVGILSQSQRGPWVWSRVAGDALDLSALGAVLRNNPSKKNLVGAAIASVAAVTALDIATGTQLTPRTAA
jgi:hypothetical protein